MTLTIRTSYSRDNVLSCGTDIVHRTFLFPYVCIHTNVPINIEYEAFDKSTYNGILFVPKGSYLEYSNHPVWDRFSKIVEDGDEIVPIDDIAKADIKVRATVDGISVIGAAADIYTVGGVLVAGDVEGNVALPAGVYVVKSNGTNRNILVK
ncbi:MAG: hypothetical protein K6E54_09025 [Bacteroidaceae bacterium]|nr:hypothetical protein [Bacteroidaceae bacterium]